MELAESVEADQADQVAKVSFGGATGGSLTTEGASDGICGEGTIFSTGSVRWRGSGAAPDDEEEAVPAKQAIRSRTCRASNKVMAF